MSAIAYPHIEVASDGKARIAGTGFKVRMLVEEQLATGADAIELQENHPHLSLAEVYAALAYCHDHKGEIDREIDELHRAADALRATLENPAVTTKLLDKNELQNKVVFIPMK